MRHLNLNLIGLLSFSCGLALSGCSGSFVENHATTGTLTVSSSTVDFGQVAVGKTASTNITLLNQGSAPVEISELNLTGQFFAMSGGSSMPMAVAANGSLTFTIKFDPASSGAATGQLTVTSNAANGSSASVALSGMGVPVLSGLTCASGAITGAGTDSCSVTLNAAADSGLGVSLTSSSSAVVVPASVTIAAGSTSAQFTANVSPVTSVQAATLTASVGGVAEAFDLQLGAAIPTLGISASSLAFGSVPVNSAVTQPLTLSSTGTAPVTVSAAALLGSSFSISGEGLPVTLAPGQTATLSVQFNPTAAGSATGQITLTSSSLAGSSTAVSLSGTGVPVLTGLSCASSSMVGSGTDSCTVTLNAAAASGGFTVNLSSSNSLVTIPSTVTVAAGASTASFAATVSSVSTAQTVTLTASAGGAAKTFALQLGTGVPVLSALSCTSGSMTGAGTDNCTVTLNTAAASGGFTVSLVSNNPAVTLPSSVTVAAGATSASFAATVSSVSTAQTVTLTASANSVTETFALQLGTAVPTLSVNASIVAFGDVILNSPATQSLTLTSTGSAAVTVSAATVTGTGFTVSGASFPLTLNPNQTATLSIQFDPTTAAATTGQLTLTSNSSTGSSIVVSLSGTGEPLQVNLTWDAPGSSSDPVAGYNVYRSPSGATSYQQLNTSAVTQTAYVDTTVQAGQTYDYMVESVDASGVASAPSNMASVTIP